MAESQAENLRQAMVRGDGRIKVGELLRMRRLRNGVSLLLMASRDTSWNADDVTEIEESSVLPASTVARYMRVLDRARCL